MSLIRAKSEAYPLSEESSSSRAWFRFDTVGDEDTELFKMGEDAVDESPSSISTGDKGTIVGDSEGEFPNAFSSTLMVSSESIAIALAVARGWSD